MSDETVPVGSTWVPHGPARGYSWKQFEPGNTVRLTHGAHSPRVYGPVAEGLAEWLVELRPDLAAYPAAVAAWARTEAQLQRLTEWVVEHGEIDERGELRSGRWLTALERLALQHRQALGLDPTSAARLARERAEATAAFVDLEGVVAAGRAASSARAELEVGP